MGRTAGCAGPVGDIMSGDIHRHLSGQREAIDANLQDMALAVMVSDDQRGAALVAEVIEQCREVVRWTIYDPAAQPAT